MRQARIEGRSGTVPRDIVQNKAQSRIYEEASLSKCTRTDEHHCGRYITRRS